MTGCTAAPSTTFLPISTVRVTTCGRNGRNGEKRSTWSGGAPRQSLPSSPFFHAGFAPACTSFSLAAAGFPLAAALSLDAFFICWVLEAGLGAVEPLLPVEPEP